MTTARKLPRRCFHILRELGPDALAPVACPTPPDRRRGPHHPLIPRLPTRSQIVLPDPPGVAALPKRPSGRSRLPRSDPSTISSPPTTPRTQIRPGVRGAIRSTDIPHNHSPPTLTNAPIQIRSTSPREAQACSHSRHAIATMLELRPLSTSHV